MSALTIVATETPVGNGPERYEQRFTVNVLGHPVKVVRRPVSVTPADGTVAMVDTGDRYSLIARGEATFKNGMWIDVKWAPTHWTVLEDQQSKSRPENWA